GRLAPPHERLLQQDARRTPCIWWACFVSECPIRKPLCVPEANVHSCRWALSDHPSMRRRRIEVASPDVWWTPKMCLCHEAAVTEPADRGGGAGMATRPAAAESVPA